VLWGKSKDEPPSNSSNDHKVAASATQMATKTQERTETLNQDFVALDLTKVRPNDESD
jgi:hypothetical protein